MSSGTKIYQMNDDFDFQKINLFSPVNTSGGTHFIQILLNNETPFYVQPPKCHTKQGFIKSTGGLGTGKKTNNDLKRYCDLVFLNNNESFLRWFENLEIYCQNIIFNNRESWFANNLEKEDIENSMPSVLKSYKGKYYTLRVNVPSNVKMFDENENEMNSEMNISSSDKNLICIIEIKGIKCSSRYFQIEMEMKQMMIFNENENENNIFNKCLVGEKKQNLLENEKNIIQNKIQPPIPISNLPSIKNVDSFSIPSSESANLVKNEELLNTFLPIKVENEKSIIITQNELQMKSSNTNSYETKCRIIKNEMNKKHLAMSSFFNKRNIRNVNMLFNEEMINSNLPK